MRAPALKGFTLIELLIVVAIIAILAGIAVPNFLEAQTRAKVTRVKNDLRAVATALEAYRVDYSRYPPCGPNLSGEEGLWHVSRPVSFIVEQNLTDIYRTTRGGSQRTMYGYMSRDDDDYAFSGVANPRNGQWWMITSNGPDMVLNDYKTTIDNDSFQEFVDTLYDPTNGTISPGNLYRSGGAINGKGQQAGRFVNNFAPMSVNGG